MHFHKCQTPSIVSHMEKSFEKILTGYQKFRKKYATGDQSIMEQLAIYGQRPQTMLIACSDSRVDPALVLQCEPGEIFTVRNVANIIPPYESDDGHHGTSAALEFGICYLNVKHLIIMGHSQCGGIQALSDVKALDQDDFISNWVSLIKLSATDNDTNTLAKNALLFSYQNCLTFPWIKKRLEQNELAIHLWFFDIETGQIQQYSFEDKVFENLD